MRKKFLKENKTLEEQICELVFAEIRNCVKIKQQFVCNEIVLKIANETGTENLTYIENIFKSHGIKIKNV